MNPFLRIARHTSAMLISGVTGVYIYLKIRKFDKCKQKLEEKKDDPSFLIPPPVKKLVYEVMDEMKLKEKEKSQIKLFFSEAPDFQRYGSSDNPLGALLGVPQYFIIDENTDINEVRYINSVSKEHQTANSKEYQNFSDSLHLSYEAKKFAIARELYEVLNANEHILHTMPLALSMPCIIFSYIIEKFSRNNYRKRSYYLPHVLTLCLGAMLYITVFDLIILYTETHADFLACNLGESYPAGGIEYYNKMIKKNHALKKMVKNAPYFDDGEIRYSVFGKHHMPLQKRLIYLTDILNSKEKKPFIWKYIITVH